MTSVASPSQQTGFSQAALTAYNSVAQNSINTNIQTLAGTGNNYNGIPPNEPTDNKPFDTRMRRVSLGTRTSNQAATVEGSISTVSFAPNPSNASGAFACYFLFNPTEIDLDYSFDSTVTGAINPAFTTAGQDTQGLMLNQTQSFTLLFDRTYEVWSGLGHPQAATVQNGGPFFFGAQWDVWAIERLVGIYGQASGLPASGPPAANICQVNFGGSSVATSTTGSNETGGIGLFQDIASSLARFSFQGWMTDFEVEYTRFDANMTPTRAAVSLSFMQVYSLPAVYTTTTVDPDSTPGVNAQGGSSTITPTNPEGPVQDTNPPVPAGGGLVS